MSEKKTKKGVPIPFLRDARVRARVREARPGSEGEEDPRGPSRSRRVGAGDARRTQRAGARTQGREDQPETQGTGQQRKRGERQDGSAEGGELQPPGRLAWAGAGGGAVPAGRWQDLERRAKKPLGPPEKM